MNEKLQPGDSNQMDSEHGYIVVETAPARRPGRRLRRLFALAALVPMLVLGTPQIASAETDSTGQWCVSHGGYQRSCTYVSMNWRSGISWQANSFDHRDTRADGWYSTVDVKLDRVSGWSDTSWMRVTRVGDWQYWSRSISGYDPTSGAWVRQCSFQASTGSGYCWTKYFTDNS
jgi:hypothetical protein